MTLQTVVCIIISSTLLTSSASPPRLQSPTPEPHDVLFERIAKSFITRSTGEAGEEIFPGNDEALLLQQQQAFELKGVESGRSEEDQLDPGLETPRTSEDIIRSTLAKIPEAVFYTGENLTDSSAVLRLHGDGSDRNCFNRVEPLNVTIKSVDPRGTCLRLFISLYCVGLSLAIYPGSPNVPNIQDSRFQNVTALGPCLRNEFDFSTATVLSNSSSPEGMSFRIEKNLTNPHELPDLLPRDKDSCAEDRFTEIYGNGTQTPRFPVLINDCKQRLETAGVMLCNPEIWPNCTYPNLWKTAGQNSSSKGPSPGVITKGLSLPPNTNLEGLSRPAIEGFVFQSEESAQEWTRFTHYLVDRMVKDEILVALLEARFLYENEETTQASGFFFSVVEVRNTSVPFQIQAMSSYEFIRS